LRFHDHIIIPVAMQMPEVAILVLLTFINSKIVPRLQKYPLIHILTNFKHKRLRSSILIRFKLHDEANSINIILLFALAKYQITSFGLLKHRLFGYPQESPEIKCVIVVVFILLHAYLLFGTE